MSLSDFAVRQPSRPFLRRGHPLTQDLLFAYPVFEGAGGTLHDVSGRQNHTTSSTGVTTSSWTTSPFGRAVNLDGSDDDFTLPTLGVSGDQSITIQAWINPDTEGKNNIYGQGTTGTNKQVCSLRTSGGANDGALDNGYRFYFWNDDFDATSNFADYENAGWYHIAGVYNANTSTRSIYEDGDLLGSDNPQDGKFTDNNYVVGGFNGENFDGQITNIRVYTRALSQTEIKNSIENPMAPFITKPR